MKWGQNLIVKLKSFSNWKFQNSKFRICPRLTEIYTLWTTQFQNQCCTADSEEPPPLNPSKSLRDFWAKKEIGSVGIVPKPRTPLSTPSRVSSEGNSPGKRSSRAIHKDHLFSISRVLTDALLHHSLYLQWGETQCNVWAQLIISPKRGTMTAYWDLHIQGWVGWEFILWFKIFEWSFCIHISWAQAFPS